MANGIGYLRFNRIFLYFILFTFTLTHAIPTNAIQVNVNERAFVSKMERLVSKLKSTKYRSSSSMISALVDIKKEIESSFNIKIDTDHCMKLAENKLAASRASYSHKQMSAISKMIKEKEKKSSGSKKLFGIFSKETQDKQEVELPSELVFGVTIALCGLFLMFVPFPSCYDWGTQLVIAGVSFCVSPIAKANDERKKK